MFRDGPDPGHLKKIVSLSSLIPVNCRESINHVNECIRFGVIIKFDSSDNTHVGCF